MCSCLSVSNYRSLVSGLFRFSICSVLDAPFVLKSPLLIATMPSVVLECEMRLEPGSYLPRPSTSVDRFARGHSIPNLTPFPLYLWRFLTSCSPPSRFCDAGLLQSPLENSKSDDTSMEEKTLRHRREVDSHGRWTGNCVIVVPGGDSYDRGPALGTVDTGTILVTDEPSVTAGTEAGSIHSSTDVGPYRACGSNQRTIEWLPPGRSGGMEPRLLVRFPTAGDAGDQPHESETGNGKDGKWGEGGRRTRPNTSTADMVPIATGGSGLESLLQSVGPVRSDRIEGVSFFNDLVTGSCWFVDVVPFISAGLGREVEGCGLVSSRGPGEGTGGCSEPPFRRDDRGCGVGDRKSRRIDEGGETERLDEFVLPVPTDPYIDFVLGLDDTTYGGSKRTSEPSVATRLGYPSASETLRRLESAIGLPTGADTVVDLIPMDFNATLSESVTRLPLSGEGEARGWGKPSGSSPSWLPFRSSISKFPTLAPYSLWPGVALARDHALMDLDLSSSLDAPIDEDRSMTPRVSATVSGSGPMSGSVESASALTNPGSAEIQGEVFSGPRLFPDDDGMEYGMA